MTDLFDPGVAGFEDLLLVESLSKEIEREGWTQIVLWPGGIRASGKIRSRAFGVLHLKHQKGPRRRALVRQTVLRLLEHRARTGFSDELCLVTDADLDIDSSKLLSSAGIDWRRVEVVKHRHRNVLAGTTARHIQLSGTPTPVSAVGQIRGAGKHRRGAQRVGSGPGNVTARMRLSGKGEIDLPGTFAVVAADEKYQSGILVVGIRVRLDVELEIEFFCLNRDARPTSTRTIFTRAVFVNEPRFLNLVSLIRDKVVTTSSARDLIQQAVWQIGEDGRMEDDTKKGLEALATRRLE